MIRKRTLKVGNKSVIVKVNDEQNTIESGIRNLNKLAFDGRKFSSMLSESGKPKLLPLKKTK